MTTQTEVEVSTDCVCDDDEVCFGCWQDSIDDLHYSLVSPWLAERQIMPHERLRIDGNNMGWRHLDGYTVCEASASDIVKALSLRGEYRLRFWRDDNGNLVAQRYSHDEPTGTGLFTFTLASAYEE